MSSIVELSASGELCQAAYSPLVKGSLTVTQLALKASGERNMSAAQAQDFANRYTVVEVFTDNQTGAFAAVFEDKSGRRTLAIRGTDISRNMDWVSNAYVATGIPPSLNPQFVALRPVIAQWIQSGALPPGSTISGHSLGGYLAAALKASFPSTFASTYTFNAPGFVQSLGGLQGVLQSIFGMPVPQTGVVDVRGSAGLSVIAGVGNHLGTLSALEIELWMDLSNPGSPITYRYEVPTQRLTVAGAGSVVVINDFVDGDVGIFIPKKPKTKSDSAPMREVMLDGENGRLVDFFDADAIANAAIQTMHSETANVGWRLQAMADAQDYGMSLGVSGYDALLGLTARRAPEHPFVIS
jgi:hypothetical protein